MVKTEILDRLIKEGEELTSTISYVNPGPNVIRVSSIYRTFQKENYQNWISAVLRFIKTNFSSEYDDLKEATKKLTPGNHQKILGTLKAIKMLPDEPKKEKVPSSGNTSITIHNTQQIVLNLFVEAIKDEISGKDYKALKEILKNYEREPEETESKLRSKLKGFGGDVLSNIVSNILTNPNIYSGLF